MLLTELFRRPLVAFMLIGLAVWAGASNNAKVRCGAALLKIGTTADCPWR